MPRPPAKRRRHNSQVRGFALRSPHRGPRIPDQKKSREDHERRISQKTTGSRPDDSDDSEDLVTTRKTGSSRTRRKVEVYASGAVAKGDTPGRYPNRSRRSRSLREDTDEILSQRSRSASRATSEVPAESQQGRKLSSAASSSPMASKDRNPTKATAASSSMTAAAAGAASVVRRPATNAIMNTPQAENSVLGKIKPRKRQASILQLIENEHDSTSFMSDDMSGFLPDEISTPVTLNQSKTPLSNGTTSMKRKRASGLPAQSTSSTPAVAVHDVLSPPSRSQQRKLSISRPVTDPIDDDIMAPPASSDAEEDKEDEADALVETRARVPRRAQRITKPARPAAPSTEQLQDLMPSKKRNPQKKSQKTRSGIPDDSDHASEDENDVSSFMPGRSKNVRKRTQKSSKSTKSKTSQEPTKDAVTRSRKGTKVQTKSTRINSYTPSPAQDPVSTSRLLASTLKESQAKSPSKQEPNRAMQDKSTNPSQPSATRTGKKQYGGSRALRNAAAGKENQPALSSNGLSSSEARVELSIPTNLDKIAQTTAEVKAWSRKWANIDDFEMDFEDISASTTSSSPMAR